MFISNFQNKIQTKIEMLKFLSFTQMIITRSDYQNLVSSHELKTPSSHCENFESVPQNSYQPFNKKNKGFLKLDPPQPNQQVDNQVATINMKNSFAFGDINKKFTPLSDILHNTMLQLLNKNMISLPHVRALDPTKPLPSKYRKNSYCIFH
jgi:hypothetical protein